VCSSLQHTELYHRYFQDLFLLDLVFLTFVGNLSLSKPSKIVHQQFQRLNHCVDEEYFYQVGEIHPTKKSLYLCTSIDKIRKSSWTLRNLKITNKCCLGSRVYYSARAKNETFDSEFIMFKSEFILMLIHLHLAKPTILTILILLRKITRSRGDRVF